MTTLCTGAKGEGLELLRESGLLQNAFGTMPGLDLAISREIAAVVRAVPDVVIAASMAHEIAAVVVKGALQLGREVRHVTRAVRRVPCCEVRRECPARLQEARRWLPAVRGS